MKTHPTEIEVLEYYCTGNGCALAPVWTTYPVSVWHEDGPRIKIDKRNVRPWQWRAVGHNQIAGITVAGVGAALQQIPPKEMDIRDGESIGEWVMRRKAQFREGRERERQG